MPPISSDPGTNGLAGIWTRFSPDDLQGQFLLGRSPPAVHWPVDSLDGWHLAVAVELPCHPVFIGDRKAGWLLGRAVSAAGAFVDGPLSLAQDEIERQIYSFGGRFAFILPAIGRVYLDPCGLLSVVYCGKTGSVASTASALGVDASAIADAALVERMRLPASTAMFPLGMTAWRDIERLLPNHYLDLNTWQPRRHWPRGELPPVADVDGAAEEIAGLIRNHLLAFLKQGNVWLQLTAGRDSRMLLACVREHARELRCLTADYSDDTARTDIRVARTLAEFAGVAEHKVLRWVEPTQDDLDLWVYRTGLGAGEYRGWRGFTQFRQQVDPHDSVIYGSVGEVARSFYWRFSDNPATGIATERLLAAIHCPATPETMRRIDAWRETAPVQDSLQLLDLFYIEQRLGCWAGIWPYAGYTWDSVFPMSHRRILELMMGLPAKFRRAGKLPERIVSREWPELNRFPYNPVPLRRRLRSVLRSVKNAILRP